MKKLSIVTAIAVLISMHTITAQEGFSAKVGLNSVSVKTDLGAIGTGSVSNSEIGFYAGAGYNFSVNDSFSIEPAALVSIVSDLTSLYVPIMVQYKISDGFFAQGGPQLNYLLEDVPDGALGIDLAIGAGYNFDENWYVEAKYGFEVARGGDFGEFTSINTLSIGTGYRFN
ncbi:MAG: outer membrane beta-barrel protein [Psychroserpens sp.]|uniref:outer membrane beta-barrel protein n=1 Tax=Psychroserpens sp. TaxID=2020870 RepID=UPI003C75EBC7